MPYSPPVHVSSPTATYVGSSSTTTSFAYTYSPFIGPTNTQPTPYYPNTTLSGAATSTVGGVATSTYSPAVFHGGAESKDKKDAGLFAFVLAIASAAYLI